MELAGQHKRHLSQLQNPRILLARVPDEIVKQRGEYYAKQHNDKVEALDKDLLKEEHQSMPINIDRQSRVTFGGSKKS